MRLLQTPANWFLLAGGKTVGAVQTAFGFEPKGRVLSGDERTELDKIYAGAVDLSRVVIKQGAVGVFAFGGAPFTHTNTIYIPDGWLPAESDSDYARRLTVLLAHETMHVWQYQNGGLDYMTESLWHQFAGWRKSGSRGAAYDFESAIKADKTWAELNPEQQARFIESLYESGYFNDETRNFVFYGTDYTAYAREAVVEMRAGRGAP